MWDLAVYCRLYPTLLTSREVLSPFRSTHSRLVGLDVTVLELFASASSIHATRVVFVTASMRR